MQRGARAARASANAGSSSEGDTAHFGGWDLTGKIVQGHARCSAAAATADVGSLQSASVTEDTLQHSITRALHARPARFPIAQA